MIESGASGLVTEEDPHLEWDRVVLHELQLKEVLDPKYKAGLSFTKCCHAFCKECIMRRLNQRDRKCPACSTGIDFQTIKDLYLTS